MKDELIKTISMLLAGIPNRKSEREATVLHIQCKSTLIDLAVEYNGSIVKTYLDTDGVFIGFTGGQVNAFDFMYYLRHAEDVCRFIKELQYLNNPLQDNNVLPPEYNKKTMSKFNLSVTELLGKLNLCYRLMGKDDVRGYLNGMAFEIKDKILYFIATTGQILGRVEVCKLTEKNEDDIFIVPHHVIEKLVRLLKSMEGHEIVSVVMYRDKLVFESDKFTLTSGYVDANFPEYERVLRTQDESALVLKLETKELKEAIKKVSIDYAKLKVEKDVRLHKILKIDYYKSQLILQTHNDFLFAEQGILDKELHYNVVNPEIVIEDLCMGTGDVSIGFDINLLGKVLQGIKLEEITVSFLTGADGLMITFDADYDNQFVVMPCRC